MTDIIRENAEWSAGAGQPAPYPAEFVSDANIPYHSEDSARGKVFPIRRMGSLEIAEKLLLNGACKSVCVLNFANNFTPGGPGRLQGSTQEEILFRRTTLGATLDAARYPLDDVENLGRAWKYRTLRLAYSPQVHVVRDTDGKYAPMMFPLSVITCAAIQMPRTRDGRYENDEDRKVTRRKIQMILDIAIDRGHRVLVAGEWGCGAFLNPLEVCEIWVEEIARRPITVAFPTFQRAFHEKLKECMASRGM
jgi:uncharacterized protein (TIGR02452 family)